MRRIPSFLAVSLISLGLAPSAGASEGLDVEAWLRKPGAKLLAVEFFATWCGPCKEAVPRWRALHERYRDEGLRFVVVITQDPKGGCTNPGWNPDHVICDDDGRLAERFGANSLPSAFLWSWQGKLLVKGGSHVDQVEKRIAEWMREAPRASVDAGEVDPRAGIDAATLRDMVRTELKTREKLTVIATDQEREKLDRLKAESMKARYDERLQCEVGKEVPANSMLEARITGGERPRLFLSLVSAERGCLVASSVVDWSSKNAGRSVAEGVDELIERLRPSVDFPFGSVVANPLPPPPRPRPPPIVETPIPRRGDYEGLNRELADREARQKAYQAELEKAWTAVAKYARSDLETSRKKAAVDDFLSDFPRDNPHRSEAEALLRGFVEQDTPRRTEEVPGSSDASGPVVTFSEGGPAVTFSEGPDDGDGPVVTFVEETPAPTEVVESYPPEDEVESNSLAEVIFSCVQDYSGPLNLGWCNTGHAVGLHLGSLLYTAAGKSFKGLAQVGLYASTGWDFDGLFQLGAIVNVEKDFSGMLQLGVLAARTDGELYGVQLAPYASSEKLYGLQAGGLTRVDDEIVGVQLGVINLAKEMSGLQIGLVNFAEELGGFQIGLINVTENAGFLPILNWGFGGPSYDEEYTPPPDVPASQPYYDPDAPSTEDLEPVTEEVPPETSLLR